jgi:8-oxo-dGTP diphosphatase
MVRTDVQQGSSRVFEASSGPQDGRGARAAEMSDGVAIPVVDVTAAVLRRGEAVLLARRQPGKSQGGLWEFPGGKIEPGETPEACLARELAEEFGIEVEVGEYLLTSRYSYSHITVDLHAYAVRYVGGELRLVDHDAVAWVQPRDLGRYAVPPADEPIVAWLRRSASGA